MAAFKAANLHQGGGTLSDFVRWHSPRDWLADDQDEGVGEPPATAAPAALLPRLSDAKAPRGRLSARMAAADNVWAQLWAEAVPAAAAEQRPLQDPTAAGESVLHWLETVAPADLFAALLAAAASAAGGLLAAAPGAALPSADAALRSAAAQTAAVLARACPYPDEWRGMCDAVAHAEAVVARAEWLRRRLPAAPVAAEALLAASLASTAPAEAQPSDDAEREALVAAAVGAADMSAPVATREFLLCAATAGPPGAPPLRHRLHATVAPGRAEVATVVASPDP
jgi:Rab3 GTPase-activating protein catalytic subunit